MTDKVRVVKPDEMDSGPLTPGMSRSTAVTAENLWMGEVRTEPGVTSGWHHHGDHTTYGRVLSGKVQCEFGVDGKEIVEAGPGDFFMVPAHTVHREGNPGNEEHVLVVMRIGDGPTVINVDGPEQG